MHPTPRRRTPIEQVDDILRINNRILDMNERLLNAILNHNDIHQVVMTGEPVNVDDLLRTGR